MRPISEMPANVRRGIRTIYCDIDDTMTTGGRIPEAAFRAIWQAHDAGLDVVPVTGRPAGWCDHIARMWPVSAVVGENGALAFSMRPSEGGPPVMQRLFAERPPDATERLERIREEVLRRVPGAKVAADQPYRLYDLAIDFCEEVAPLDAEAIDRIVEVFEAHGATAKVSSIHVNGWFGAFDKLSMCKRLSEELFDAPLAKDASTFVGDSPNDVPMFRYFPHAIGVANIRSLLDRVEHPPSYVTESEGGAGFAEAIQSILALG